MTRRYSSPYNGKRFLANSNTKEIHDLDNELTLCQINSIKTEHIIMLDYISEVESYIRIYGYNGCYWCLRKYNTG